MLTAEKKRGGEKQGRAVKRSYTKISAIIT